MQQLELEAGRAGCERRGGATKKGEEVTLDASSGTVSARRTVFVALRPCKSQVINEG